MANYKFPVKVIEKDYIAEYAKKLINGEEQLLIEEQTGSLFLTDGKGGFIICNKSNGEEQKPQIDLSKYLDKATYDPNSTGMIQKSKQANEIVGVVESSPLTYYGKDNSGNIGFHYFPINPNDNGNGINQRVKLDTKAGETFILDLNGKCPNTNLMVQVFNYVPGEQNIVQVLKDFNNGDESNFLYDENNTIFDGTARVKKSYEIKVNKISETEFESEEIDTTQFINFIGIV